MRIKIFCVPCKSSVVESLDLSQKNLEEVPKEVFKAKKTLDELNLSLNNIEVLPKELFKCVRLQSVDLSLNKIRVLPVDVALWKDLRFLNLSNNGVQDIPDEIGQCVNLVHLDISSNICNIPRSIINLTQLTMLNVSDTSITQLPNEINELVNLEFLDASKCDLTVLPNSIVFLNKLETVDFNENRISKLPEEMGRLKNLKTLDLRENLLSALPESLLQCRNLQFVDLSRNQLSELPHNLGDLNQMIELVLCENRITALPPTIGQMKKLETLKLASNQLLSLTPAICSCISLTDLYLADNLIRDLPSSLGNLNKLRFLDVSKNQLSSIPSTVGSLTSLGVLALRENKITQLPMEIGKLQRLRVLDVAFNNLSYLPYTLKVLENLKALWLSLRQLPLPALQTIELPNKVKALTCIYLPQTEDDMHIERGNSKNFVRGTRVNFTNNPNEATIDYDDEEKHYPIGNFERQDTPHPKQAGSKYRKNGEKTGEDGSPVVQEPKQLRSVLKKRPVSTYSEAPAQARERGTLYTIKTDEATEIGCSFRYVYHDNNNVVRFVFIENVIPGQAVYNAGLRNGDRVIAINDLTFFHSLVAEDVNQLLREAGREFTLRIERSLDSPPQEQAPFAVLDRPPSRIGSRLDLAIDKDQGTSSVQPSGGLSTCRSLPSLADPTIFGADVPPPLPPKRSASRNHLIEPSNFDFNLVISSLKKNPAPSVPKPKVDVQFLEEIKASNSAIINAEFMERMEKPLASSSPIPPKSRIPIKDVRPPPIAPKPSKVVVEKPERMDFDSKRRHFEDKIKEETPGVSVERPSHPPPKKPLTNVVDVQNNRAELIPMIDEESSLDKEAQDFFNGNIGPKVIRTKNAKIRFENLQQQRLEAPSPALSDISAISEVVDQRARELEERRAWRAARLQSMDQESLKTEEIMKKLSSVSASPIPTQ